MKRNFVLVALAMFFLLLVPSFQATVSAQSNNVIVDGFVAALNKEFVANKDVMTVKSVARNGNIITIDASATNKAVPAEHVYEVLEAARKYVADHPTPLPDDYKAVYDALVKMDAVFHISVKDVGSNKKHVVKYAAKEFVGAYVLEDSANNPEMVKALYEYMPFDKVISIMNASSPNAGQSFQLEDGYLYVVFEMGAAEYKDFKEMYDYDSVLLASMMKKAFFAELDESSKLFVDLAHKNNYKIGLKVSSHGCETLALALE